MEILSREFALSWGTFALIVAGIAQGKNRSGLVWGFLSLLFGPLALFVLLLLDKLQLSEENHNEEDVEESREVLIARC